MSRKITFISNWHGHQFEQFIGEKLREAFPNVSFHHLQQWEHDISNWTRHDEIDIRIGGAPDELNVKRDELRLLEPSLIDSSDIHPDFIPHLIEEKSEKWIGLPFDIGCTYAHALLYNKELFQKFRVPAPEHGMTWDEIIALSRQVSGLIDGKVVYGLDLGEPSLLKMQLGFTFLDPITHEPKLDDPKCLEYFRIVREAYQIPGNLQDSNERLFVYGKAFFRKANVAMSNHYICAIAGRELPFNCGAVTFPRPNGTSVSPSLFHPGILYANPNSLQYELAVEVMTYLASESFQLHLARYGLIPAKVGRLYEAAFGQNVPHLAEKSITPIFASEKKGWPDPQSPYESEASSIIKHEMEFAVRGWRSWNKSIAAMEFRLQEMLESKQVTSS